MRDSNGTRVFNLLAVALLIQHVARVAHAAAHVSVSRSAASSSPSLLSSASSAAYAIGGTAGAPAAHASLGDADTDDDSGHRSADGVLARANARAGVDFAAYVNDFNMQAEASIPEDILDQQHIEDADVIDEADSMQYAAGGGMERAADIILEAQRSSTSGKNFTSYNVHLNENNNKSNYNNNNGNDSQKQRKHNSNNLKQKNHYNKFQNNRDNKSNGDYDVAVAAAVATFDDNGDDDDMDLDVEFDAAVGAANNVDMGDGGAEFLDSSTDALVLAGNEHVASKKFTSADERQQQQRRQQQQLNAAASLEHMEVIEKFDEQGKFNKVSAQTTSQEANTPTANDNNYAPSSSNGNININRKSLLEFEDNDVDVDADADADGNQLQESAIGDIEDNFRDEDEDEDEATATAGREYKNVAAALATDETVAAEYPPAAQRSDDALLSTAAFIARKIKRHNNDGRQQVAEQNRRNRRHRYGEADERDGQAENENAGSGATAAKSAQSALYGGFRGDVMAERQQADYSINYFDNLTNGLNAQQQQQQPKSNSAAAAAGTQQQHSLAKIADGDDAEKIVGALRAAYQQPEATAATTTAAVEAAALSAFELYKSQRRNSRRNGHRVHKKTYKDYLRYTGKYALVDRTTTNAATTTTAPSNAATESATPTQLTNSTKDRQAAARQADAETDRTHAEKLRKYARKLEAEKARGLPASPIFVVGANRKVAADTDDQRTAKPFYEGQINYYMETKDGDDDTNAAAAIDGNTSSARQHDDKENLRRAAMGPHARSMERAIAADNSNWYRRVSPVLRNGVKTTSTNGNNEVKHAEGEAAAAQAERRHNHHQREHHHQQRLQLQHRQHQRQQHRQHRRPHGSHHYQHHHRSSHHKHHQHGKHYQSAAQQQQQQQQQTQTNPYQRKSLPHEQRQPAGPYTSAHAASLAAYTAEAAASSAPSSLSASATATSTQTPLPLPPPAYKPHAGAMQELGHQITEMEEFERYYAKWPHLARVQFQVYDEHYREAHPELYPDYEDEDYESAAELEEAQSGTDEDANLPPYIKKYNRRNKQLLNLLEGTLPPATRSPALPRAWSGSVLQPGPHDSRGGSGAAPVRIDDDYLKEKRKRYHNRHDDNSSANQQYWRDLFAPQRDAAHSATDNNNSSNHSTAAAATQTQQQEDQPAQSTNQLPDENISISAPDSDAATDVDAEADADANSVLIWPKEIENKSNANVELAGSAQMTWQIEKLTTAAPPTSTPKAAIFRLPSYPAIAGSFIGKPRSRSAQFAPSTSRGSAYTHASSSGFDLGRGGGVGRLPGKSYSSYNSNNANNYYKSTSRFSAYQPNAVAHETSYETAPPDHAATTPAATAVTGSGASSARTINSFVYHRVVDASPRLVGTGAAVGRKQRLPFVAITDRRLDTSSKSLPKDFEQNHYPMP